MRSLALVVAAAAGLVASQSAYAADLAIKSRVFVPEFNWTGFYVGLNAGGSFGTTEFDYQNSITPVPGSVFAVCGAPPGATVPVPGAPNPLGLAATCENNASFLGGGQIGYNWQYFNYVYGLEADVQWRNHDSTEFVVFGANAPTIPIGVPMGTIANDTAYLRSEQGVFGTFRARVGFVPTGSWMIYGTGGLAFGHVQHTFTEVLNPGTTCVPPSTTCRSVSDSKIGFGWTIGGGFEAHLGHGWIFGAEYLFVDLGRTTLQLAPVPGTNFVDTATATFDDTSHTGRARLSYKFQGPRLVPGH